MCIRDSTYGYNQSALGLDAATGETISASNSSQGYKNLQDEAQALSTFTGVSLFSSSSTDKASGDSITASDWNNLMTDTKSLFDARLSIPGGSLTTDASGTTTRTSGWGSAATPEITHEFTLSFSSEAHARGFFNAGGEVLFTGARSGGTSGSGAGSIGSQNTNWTNLLSAIGTVTFNLNNLTSSGATGTSAGKGFYELTTSYVQMYSKFGSGSYASNYYKIEAKVNNASNPTVVTFKVTMRDDHALGDGLGADGIDGNADDSTGYVDGVDGSIVSTIQTKRANNGVVVTAPSYSAVSNL